MVMKECKHLGREQRPSVSGDAVSSVIGVASFILAASIMAVALAGFIN